MISAANRQNMYSKIVEFGVGKYTKQLEKINVYEELGWRTKCSKIRLATALILHFADHITGTAKG